jgi:hypothetical protein
LSRLCALGFGYFPIAESNKKSTTPIARRGFCLALMGNGQSATSHRLPSLITGLRSDPAIDLGSVLIILSSHSLTMEKVRLGIVGLSPGLFHADTRRENGKLLNRPA